VELVNPLEVLRLAEQASARRRRGVPTSENARSRWPSAKSSHAAMNSRLSAARRSSSSPPPSRIDLEEGVFDVVAGRHLKVMIRRRSEPSCEQKRQQHSPFSHYHWGQCASRSCPPTRGRIRGAPRAHRGARGAVPRRGAHVRVLAPFDPPGRYSAASASRRAPADAGAAGLPRPDGAHDRLQGERRGCRICRSLPSA